MARDLIPKAPEIGMEETHVVTGNTESCRHEPAKDQEVKRGGEVATVYQRQQCKLDTASRT